MRLVYFADYDVAVGFHFLQGVDISETSRGKYHVTLYTMKDFFVVYEGTHRDCQHVVMDIQCIEERLMTDCTLKDVRTKILKCYNQKPYTVWTQDEPRFYYDREQGD